MTDELQNIATVPELDRASAERLDRRIRLLTGSISDSITKLYDLVDEAKSGRIHLALGFASWTAYVADALKVEIKLDRDRRRELVGYLSGEGMSQRAIAEVVGTSVGTVNADIAGVQNRTPEVPGAIFSNETEAADITVMAGVSDEQFEQALAEARADGDLSRGNVADKCRDRARPAVTGLDGKTYKKKSPPKPKQPKVEGRAEREEEAMRVAARAAELSAWGRACDGLLAALSYAASTVPPEDTDRYPAVEVFAERYEALGKHIAMWVRSSEAVNR